MRPWWSCGSGWLGTQGQILGSVPEPRGDNTAAVTFSYTDFSCGVTLLPAQLVLPFNGTLVQLQDCQWRVSNVPYGSFITVLMRSTNNLAAFVSMAFDGPSQQCQRLGAITDLQPVYDDVGAECLRFDWRTAGAGFPWGFTYTLAALRASDTAIPLLSGNLAGDVTSATFGAADGSDFAVNLTPSQVYRFTLEGVCSRSGTQTTGPASRKAASTVAITAPPPALGPGVTIDSVGDGVITLRYADYFCVENVRITVNRVVPLSQSPPLFTFDSASLTEGTLYVQITGSVVGGDAPEPPCTCMTPATLATTVPLYLPAPSATPCDSLTIGAIERPPTSATCLSFSWQRVPELLSYTYELTTGPDDTIVASATIAQSAPGSYDRIDATIDGLLPSTLYRLTVRGNCQNGGQTPATAPFLAVTSNASVAVLPEFDGVPTFEKRGLGLYDVRLQYSGFVCVGQPTLVARARGSQTRLQTNSPVFGTWIIYTVPANVTLECYFRATAVGGACGGDCFVAGDADVLQTSTFTLRTPSGLDCPAPPLSLTPQYAACFLVSSAATSAEYENANIQIFVGNSIVLAPTYLQLPFSYYFSRGEPNTQYTVWLTAYCPGTMTRVQSSATITTGPTVYASLDPIPPQTNWKFMPANGDDPAAYMLTFTYPVASARCCAPMSVPGVSLEGPVPETWFLGIGNIALSSDGLNYVWPVMYWPPNRTFTLMLMARASSDCGCAQPSDDAAQYITLTSPPASSGLESPPPPLEALTMDQAYTVAITNYGGPPTVLGSVGQLAGSSPTDPSFAGPGDANVLGSYMNQWLLHDKYAWNIVVNFLKYNCQRLFTFNLAPFTVPRDPDFDRGYYFTVSAVYYGIAGDPCSGGASTPTQAGTYYKAKRAYSFCDSRLGAVPVANPSVINPGTYRNFSFAPMLAFFVRLITYNWNVAKGVAGYTNNPAQIQLALTCYGSKKASPDKNEQWWFNAVIDEVTGYITTTDPSNPLAIVSIINGVAIDGNQGFDAADYTAGWNCMERWFMYAAYCNQQLRILIANRQIVADDGAVMTLDDIGVGEHQVSPTCCQISAITMDGEGNGFPNTTDWLYNPPSLNPPNYAALPEQQAACNAAITALWNKWLNQSVDGVPAGWPTTTSAGLFPFRTEAWVTTNLFAPQARPSDTMPRGAPFMLPCALSCTTTSLIPKMGFADLGAADFTAINAVFPEIYDTSDQGPFSFLGAGSGGVSFNVNSPSSGISMHDAAFPTTQTHPCASNPLTFFDLGFGVWDNLVGPGSQNSPLVARKCGNQPSISQPGGPTAYSDSSVAATPLMQTSACTPYNSGSAPWTLFFAGSYGTSDSDALAWALESSRYDLYNGLWAAGVAGEAGRINYALVRQGDTLANHAGWTSVIDGGTIWSDLSTGLKTRVANKLQHLTQPAAQKVIWMLSTQSGPFVNNMGVRFSARGATKLPTQEDALTFTCPDRLAQWPGWLSMQGQWCGPLTSATANIMQRYATDQFFNGLALTNTITQPSDIMTQSTEDNFGVFSDFGIIAGAWARMAIDMRGQTIGTDGAPISKAGIISTSGACVYPEGVPVQLGCYELAFLPLSWYNPELEPYPAAPS